jgi:hypothetical protein
MHQEHQPEHQMQGDHTQPGMKLHAAPEGRHHQKTQTAGEIETIQVTIAAQGEEGSVAADATLAGRRVVCASPDILSRLVAGAPFSIQAAKE